jgi:hypothetical protein
VDVETSLWKGKEKLPKIRFHFGSALSARWRGQILNRELCNSAQPAFLNGNLPTEWRQNPTGKPAHLLLVVGASQFAALLFARLLLMYAMSTYIPLGR